MYELDKDAADEHWYGVQEAASYLGIHRATLFRALRSGLIMADRTTPRGRARFRLATLMAFRDQLRHQAATSQEHVHAPVVILAKLAGLGRSPDPVEHSIAVMEEAVRLLCSSGGNYDMALVALRVPSEADPYALKTLAQCGLPEVLKASYTYLRPTVPFPVNVVSRTGEAEICDDISAQMTPRATAQRVLMQSNISSYAVYPIVSGSDDAGAILGVLAVCGNAPHKYSEQEKTFLAGVADALSTCITQGSLLTDLDPHNDSNRMTPATTLGVVSHLLETAYARTRCPDAARSPLLPVEALCNLVVEQSHALTTWVYGFPPQACGNTVNTIAAALEDDVLRQYRSNLQSLVQRTRMADSLRREQWHNKVTAVAFPVPLPCGQSGAVGAVWPGVRTEVEAEGVVLSTLASACSLVSQYVSGGCD
ncbi:MAG TPA: GAF domain-containing protein [Ktedonobacterales bacterium]|jgi:excisionase family DNA binding protein